MEPSLQAAFVDYGGNRHGFLAFSEIHPDYYQIPIADREALMEEERAYAEAQRELEEGGQAEKKRSRVKSRAKSIKSDDSIQKHEVEEDNSGEALDSGLSVAGESESAFDSDSDDNLTVKTDIKNSELSNDSSDLIDALDKVDPSNEISAEDGLNEIVSISEADDPLDLRVISKPRPRRYKIQEVIKVRQILLVQVVKEERGNKGAALTTYLSLAGRYCVLMPNTARGGGISRKITNAVDRKKLKEIAGDIEVPSGAGLIVRTAGAKRTKTEIKRDYEYLQRLWEQIRELTLKSIAPSKIYEEGDLVKRSIRDLYNRDIDEVLVEGEIGHKIAKDFMRMIMPSHTKNVKQYSDPLPLFSRYQVETYLTSMFNPVVQLKSGGYLVIGVTEALVAIDVNSGRATKEGSIEETALKTNLEAAEEVSRQLRLRDLAGLIVIDFIDMEDRRNNSAVERKLKDKLKTDRARIQVGRISGFGLLEMSRQRLRPGMIEATTQNCSHCHGTGLIRSEENLALSIIRQIEDEGVRGRSSEIIVKCPVSVANFIVNQKREHIANIEARFSLFVRINADTALVSPEYSIEKLKTSSKPQGEKHGTPVSSATVGVSDVGPVGENDNDEPLSPSINAYADDDDGKPKKRRRRRRRKSKQGVEDQEVAVNGIEKTEESDVTPAGDPKETSEIKNSISNDQEAENKKLSRDDDANTAVPKRKRSPRKKTVVSKDNEQGSEASDTDSSTTPELRENDEGGDALKAKSKPRARKKVIKETDTKDAGHSLNSGSISEGEEPVKKSDKKVKKVSKSKSVGTKKASTQSVTAESMDEDINKSIIENKVNTLEGEETKKTRRRGWWSKKS